MQLAGRLLSAINELIQKDHMNRLILDILVMAYADDACNAAGRAKSGQNRLAGRSRRLQVHSPILVFLILALVAHAQEYSIDWYKVSGGGGASTGGVYSVSGTIGQHDAGGPMTGGNYSLTGGFWALYAVQTPGAPLLAITHLGNQA